MIQFSDTTGKSGLIQECEMILFGDSGYGQISGNPNRLNYFTNLLNQSMVKIIGAIYTCDGKWQQWHL